MKLELTLKCELTGIFVSFLLLNHPCGPESRSRNPRGAAGWSGASLESSPIFWEPLNSAAPALGLRAQEGRVTGVLECAFFRLGLICTDGSVGAAESWPFPTARQFCDWLSLSSGNSALSPQSVRMELLRQLERGRLSFQSRVHVVCSRDWKNSLKGK